VCPPGAAGKQGKEGCNSCEKKYGGLSPSCGCIRDTLIEQSRSRYSNRAVMIFLENQFGKLLYAVIIRRYSLLV